MYLDCDCIITRASLLPNLLSSCTRIKMLRARYISEFTSALVPDSLKNYYCFDACFVFGKSDFLIELFSRCKQLLPNNLDIFRRYSDMPFINRALADLQLDPEEIKFSSGVTWAHNTNDFTKELYHFNSGSSFRKLIRMHRFKIDFRQE